MVSREAEAGGRRLAQGLSVSTQIPGSCSQCPAPHGTCWLGHQSTPTPSTILFLHFSASHMQPQKHFTDLSFQLNRFWVPLSLSATPLLGTILPGQQSPVFYICAHPHPRPGWRSPPSRSGCCSVHFTFTLQRPWEESLFPL